MENIETRMKEFSKECRKEGIGVLRNVQACCPGCANVEEKIGSAGALIWSYGGQGSHATIKGDEVYGYGSTRGGWRDYFPVEQIYFNHTGLIDENGLTASGRKVLELAEKYDLVFEWEQSPHKCIVFLAQKSLSSSIEPEISETVAA